LHIIVLADKRKRYAFEVETGINLRKNKKMILEKVKNLEKH